jgi:hypothetical protein
MTWGLSRGRRPTSPFLGVQTPFLQTPYVLFGTDPPASDGKEIRRREALSAISEYPAAWGPGEDVFLIGRNPDPDSRKFSEEWTYRFLAAALSVAGVMIRLPTEDVQGSETHRG